MLAELTYEAQYIDKLLILWLSGHQWPKRYLSKPRSGVLVEFRVGPVIFFWNLTWAACGFWRVAQLVVPSQIYGWWPVKFLEFPKISTNIMKGRTLLTNIKREPSVSVV